MSTPEIGARGSEPNDGRPPPRRLLVVADAAVADVDDLPPRVRAVIDDAAEIYVVAPTLPGRLDWLAWELNPSRHEADERLDAVLGQIRSIGARVSGRTGDDSILTAFADAVAAFQPDHILIALRSSEHANWQERGLIEHVKERFDLPLTTFVLAPSDPKVSSSACPVLTVPPDAGRRFDKERRTPHPWMSAASRGL